MYSLYVSLPSMTTFGRRRTIIVCHLKPSPLVATLDVETLIRFRAVEDSFVASNLLRHIIQCLYNVKAEVFALLVFGNGNILNMTDQTKIMDAINVQLGLRITQIAKTRIHTISSPQPLPPSPQPCLPHYKLPGYGTHPPSWPSNGTARPMPPP